MISLNLSVAFLTLRQLCIWTIVGATPCLKNQFWNNGLCCDFCPPGKNLRMEYLFNFLSV